MSHVIDVLSLELERSDGAVVETLPRAARPDVARYVDLAEL